MRKERDDWARRVLGIVEHGGRRRNRVWRRVGDDKKRGGEGEGKEKMIYLSE
jgi:hypothetical protein